MLKVVTAAIPAYDEYSYANGDVPRLRAFLQSTDNERWVFSKTLENNYDDPDLRKRDDEYLKTAKMPNRYRFYGWLKELRSLNIAFQESDVLENPELLLPLLNKIEQAYKIHVIKDLRTGVILKKFDRSSHYSALIQQSELSAQLLLTNKGYNRKTFKRNFIWLYQKTDIYSSDEVLNPDEATALANEIIYRKQRKINRAKAVSGSDSPTPRKRQAIPDDVKMFVWQRDEGKCVNCGSNENLEFDHIIPLSMGGSNTARNLQLLCEPCNRSKGGSLV